MEKNRYKTGLITYHAAYNFGSVLQAYATQKTLEKLGCPNEIVDYRTQSQTDWYHKDFSWKAGPLNWITTFGFNFMRKARRIRREKFERFITNYLTLSPRRYTTYEELRKEPFEYDILISGSDQIWNIGCGEFRNEPKESILPYFLDFANPKKKIAYASSIGGQPLNNIKKYAPYLLQFDALSTREPSGARIIGKAANRDIEVVVDPTWLLTRKDWQIEGVYTPKTKRGYILWYTLYMFPWKMKKWLKVIKAFAARHNLDVYCISPLVYCRDKEVHWIDDAGPIDFLSYMMNASCVITNTFHGTIFPMNFNVPFFSCNAAVGSRQGQMLALCNLEGRVINSPMELCEITDYSCDFTEANITIEKMRRESVGYLKNALEHNR